MKFKDSDEALDYIKSKSPEQAGAREPSKRGSGLNSLTKTPMPQVNPTGKIPKYNRKDYPHWVDSDGDCQDTRSEILQKQNIGKSLKFKRDKACNVSWGSWIDPYSKKNFTKASDLDIDHIIPLEHAHYAGAWKWDRNKKREFANDPENLIAVQDKLNSSKGSKDITKWLPPNSEFHCEYAKRWQKVKIKYALIIRPKEQLKIDSLLKECK